MSTPLDPAARVVASLTATREAATSLPLRVDRLTSTRPALIYCFALALAAYGIESIAWPVALAAWAGYNSVRYDDFVVARTGNADVPFYRTFVVKHIVSPTNGAASQELADSVRTDLLPKYHAQFSARRFFSTASDRMWGDLVVVTDRRWGWSDYALLRKVALEAISSPSRPVRPRCRVRRRHGAVIAVHMVGTEATAAGCAYPAPFSTIGHVAVRPERPGRRAVVGRQHTRRPYRKRPERKPRVDEPRRPGAPRVVESVDGTASGGPSESERLGARGDAFNDVSRFFPRPWMWLALGALALAIRRPRRSLAPAALATLGLVVIVGTMLGMPSGLEYRVPVEPVFILFACAAITLPSRKATRRGAS